MRGRVITLYRASTTPDAHAKHAFSPDVEVAEAYLDNPGFGGPRLYRYDVEVDRARVLDLYDDKHAHETLGEALGFQGDALDAFLDEYAHNYIFEVLAGGWLRKEGSPRKIPFTSILSEDFDWVKYEDNYPNTDPAPETWMLLTPGVTLQGQQVQ